MHIYVYKHSSEHDPPIVSILAWFDCSKYPIRYFPVIW